jgi:single-strand DNA-binding protein
MASINRVTLIGNLGADPERSTTQGGQAYTKLRLATNENYKDSSGNWQTSTEWHTVKVWGVSADRAAQQLRKGSLVYVEGSLKSYEIGDGNPSMGQGGNRTRIWEIKALSWRSLDSKESRGQGEYNANQGNQSNYNQNQSGGFGNNGGGFGNNGGGFGNGGNSFGNGGNSFGNGGNSFGNAGNSFGNAGNSFGNGGNSFGNGGNNFGGSNPGQQASSSSDWSTNSSTNKNDGSWGATPAADQGQSNSSAWNNSGWGSANNSEDNGGSTGGSGDDPIPF